MSPRYPHAEMDAARYETALREIDAQVSPQKLDLSGGPPLVREQAAALRSAVDAEPRDSAFVRERVVALAASALRVIRSMGDAGKFGETVNPTVDRLFGLIDENAPNTANAWIATDDPLSRFCDEIVGAAERYAEADPRTVSGSSPALAGHLYRVVGLAGHWLEQKPVPAERSDG